MVSIRKMALLFMMNLLAPRYLLDGNHMQLVCMMCLLTATRPFCTPEKECLQRLKPMKADGHRRIQSLL